MRRKIKLISVLVVVFVLLFIYIFIKPYYVFATKTLQISPIQALLGYGEFKQFDNKVNILVLGIAGRNHEGPFLSDSMLVLHYDLKKNTLISLGIPRDIWSETLRDKINSAYAYGEEKQQGGGLKLAKAEVGAIIGQPVQYGVVISFEKFKKLIDMLEGVDVQVEHSFTDANFPIAGKEDDECDGDPEFDCRYESISFSEGLNHMDGETALKFVRSRYSESEEGSDFARSKRQQLVANAVKDKLLNIVKEDLQSYSLKRTESFYKELDSLVERDITNSELALLGRNFFSHKEKFQHSQAHLDHDWFIIPNYYEYDGKYVLIPEENDWKNLHTRVACILDKEC